MSDPEVAGALGTKYWNDYYGSILGNGVGPKALQDYNTAASTPEWVSDAKKDYTAALKAKNDAAVDYAINGAKPRGERNVALPDGKTIGPSGSASTDFLRGIFGVSPLDSSAKDTEGNTVAPGTGSTFDVMALITEYGQIAVAVLVAGGLVWYGTQKTLKV